VTPALVHRELLLPAPSQDQPDLVPFVWNGGDTYTLEIRREKDGRVRYALGTVGSLELDAMLSYLESARPRLCGGERVDCLASARLPDGIYARAIPVQRHHYLPIVLQPNFDHADHLLRIFASSPLQAHEVTLQVLFRAPGSWETRIFSPQFENVAKRQNHFVRAAMRARQTESAFHAEARAHVSGPRPHDALAALGVWLSGWTMPGGAAWRRWKIVPPKQEWRFLIAMMGHDQTSFASKRARRDVSGSELAQLLSIPWSSQHPECSYSGAPRGRPGPELISVPPPPSAASAAEPRMFVGSSGSHQVVLRRSWNHAVVLGRTQSGKSTLAMALALQILRKQPGSTIVVIEPTGTLVEGIVSRLPREIAAETIEIDPANSSFDEKGTKMVSVPLSLLHAPKDESTALDRWSEALAGDLLAAIRSAWGEESIGGRAELVLRALVQGLARTPGSNLVDAYQILTSKKALQRFVKTAPPGPLRDFLEHHLPRLDYNFTMSTLDKVGKIATNPILRVALCQRSHAVSFDQLLKHRLLLLNLSKAALGADGANFLGAIYLTQLWAAIQRSGRPERPIYLFLDEVHNYAIPTLADMLSEGAKYGLHVVAITQYLHRVPPRVQAALIGNVDVWLLFSLGVEDMDDAWKIVQGKSHGWTSQDLVDGLKPHEVAMATSGSLLKLETRLWPPLSPDEGGERRAMVNASSRRYAQPEDSEASPWLVDQDKVEAVLNGLANRARTADELSGLTGLRADQLAAALRKSEDLGDLERDAEVGTLRLTPRGRVHLTALLARRNEGEDHVDTLVDFCMFLGSRGIEVTIPEQVAGVLTPDAQFRFGDTVYNVEVECSTVVKAAEQVVRNIRKAREVGNSVLIALPDASSVPRVLGVLASAFPGFRLWQDCIGLVWRTEESRFLPHRVPTAEVWPFLEGEGERLEEYDQDEASARPSSALVETDPLPRVLRGIVQGFVKSGKIEATSSEIFAALPDKERTRRTDEQIGVALKGLGLKHHRVRVNGSRIRVYELATPRTDGGPASGNSVPDVRETDRGGPVRWSGNSLPENN
jgi:hypothetical protein